MATVFKLLNGSTTSLSSGFGLGTIRVERCVCTSIRSINLLKALSAGNFNKMFNLKLTKRDSNK